MNIHVIFICIGVPKPHLRHVRLAADFLIVKVRTSLFSMTMFVHISADFYVLPMLENIK